MWDDADFLSDDPFVRFNAHQAAKGRTRLPDPALLRKRERENRPPFSVNENSGEHRDPGDEDETA